MYFELVAARYCIYRHVSVPVSFLLYFSKMICSRLYSILPDTKYIFGSLYRTSVPSSSPIQAVTRRLYRRPTVKPSFMKFPSLPVENDLACDHSKEELTIFHWIVYTALYINVATKITFNSNYTIIIVLYYYINYSISHSW